MFRVKTINATIDKPIYNSQVQYTSGKRVPPNTTITSGDRTNLNHSSGLLHFNPSITLV